jgi:uncharacterized protein (DUF1330 family)
VTAYTILDVDWHDESKAAEYRRLFGPALEKHGGKTLVANAPLVLEGDWSPKRVVILEFPTMDALQGWYKSNEHAALMRLRNEGAKSRMIAVERPASP